jgi:hypothetical protein
MAKFKLEGIPPYDGEYDMDYSTITNREFHTIKRISGVRAGEVDAALNAGDNDVIVAFTVIALQRAGHNVQEDAIWDAPVGRVSVINEKAEEPERPPVSPLENGPQNEPASSEPANEKNGTSGVRSSNAGGQPPNDQSRTGSPPSETTAPSAPVTSVV